MRKLKKGRARRLREKRRRQLVRAVAHDIFEQCFRPFFDRALPPHDDEFPVIGAAKP